MDGSTVVWIVVAVLVLLALAALAVVAMRKRKEREVAAQRTQAEELRSEAATVSARDATEARVEAKEAEARAERLRLEAERAQDSAAQARQGYDVEQARVEDRIREADRVDPDVDHRSRTYEGEVAPPVAGAEPASTDRSTGSPEVPREEGPASGSTRV
jgi:uncharacterized protein HemX